MENENIDYMWYASIETMGAVDGPGLRLIIFAQGCPLACLFCHNPETIEKKQENKITIDEVIELYKKNEEFYKANDGGITFSGGEILSQAQFLLNFLKKSTKMGIHVTVDTATTPYMGRQAKKIMDIMEMTDLFLVDIKHTDTEVCRELTTMGNETQLAFIKTLEKLGRPYWIRHVYMPGFSDRKEQYMVDLGHIIGNLKYMEKFEMLPYHNMMIPKYENLGIEFKLYGVEPPSSEDIKRAMFLIQQGQAEVRKNPKLSPIYE